MYFLYGKIPFEMRQDKIPDDPFKMIMQVYFCMLLEDTYYYFSHRIFHHRLLYPSFHKLHHRYIKNVSIAGEYIHPLDFIVNNLGAISVGPVLLGNNLHFYTFIIYVLFRNGDGFSAHCGYDFPWVAYELFPLTSMICLI